MKLPPEETIVANDIGLCYQRFGDPQAPAIVLVMGLGTQMVAWPVDLCEALVEQGFQVIRYDNRDIGRSSYLSGARIPPLWQMLIFPRIGLPVRVAYTLDDMAEDAIALCDALGIEQAHFVGASMGGMIAQLVAIKYPQRCLSLCSIMSTSGAKFLPGPKPAVMRHMLRKRPEDEQGRLQMMLDLYRVIGSPGFPASDEERSRRILESFKRGNNPQGYLRQMAAIGVAKDRSAELAKLRMPVQVIHGDKDVLVPLACGRHTHESIPMSAFTVIEGMGHDLPLALVPRLAELIVGNCRRSSSALAA